MLRKLLILILLLACALPLAQAQRPRINRPTFTIRGIAASWTFDDNAEKYKIRWRPAAGGSYTYRTLDANDNTYTLSLIPYGARYRIQIQALSYNTRAVRNSYWSRPQYLTRAAPTSTPTNTATPTSTPTPTDTPTPTPHQPAKLAAPVITATGEDSISWNKILGAINYRINWTDASNDWAGHGKTLAPATAYQVADLTPGIQYRVRIRAHGDSANYEAAGPWSNIVNLYIEPTATPTPTPTDTPTPTFTFTPSNTPTNTPIPPTNTPAPIDLPFPDNLRHVGGPVVTWDAVPHALNYEVIIKGGQSRTATVSATQFTIPEFKLSTEYIVAVKTLGDGKIYEAEGGTSNPIRFTVHPTATPTATNTPLPTATPTDTDVPPPPRADDDDDDDDEEEDDQECKKTRESKSETRSCSGGGTQSRTAHRDVRVSGVCDTNVGDWRWGSWSSCPDPPKPTCTTERSHGSDVHKDDNGDGTCKIRTWRVTYEQQVCTDGSRGSRREVGRTLQSTTTGSCS